MTFISTHNELMLMRVSTHKQQRIIKSKSLRSLERQQQRITSIKQQNVSFNFFFLVVLIVLYSF